MALRPFSYSEGMNRRKITEKTGIMNDMIRFSRGSRDLCEGLLYLLYDITFTRKEDLWEKVRAEVHSSDNGQLME